MESRTDIVVLNYKKRLRELDESLAEKRFALRDEEAKVDALLRSIRSEIATLEAQEKILLAELESVQSEA